jgi:hypothetical protein
MLSSGVGVVRRVWLVVRLPHFQVALGGLGLWLAGFSSWFVLFVSAYSVCSHGS